MTIPSALVLSSEPPSRFGKRQTTRGEVQTKHNTINNDIKFGRLGPNAISQFIADTAGVYTPKVPFMRSKLQFFEDTFLELVEDAAFYFTVPLVGPLLAKLYSHLPAEEIGTGLNALNKAKTQAGKMVTKDVIAAKSGVLLGALAIACAFEYSIQFSKNMITDKVFGTKNFTAVAGLEQSRTSIQEDENDPSEKGKRRLKQTGIALASLLGLSLALPFAIRNVKFLENGARNLMKYLDFGGTVNQAGKLVNDFDISKAINSVIILTGVVSYLDAARGSLEKKEVASRLAFVVPYLLFGKELAGNALAWFFQNSHIGEGANRFKIQDKVSFLNGKSFGQVLKDSLTPDHFLDFNMVKNNIFDDVAKLNLSTEVKDAILQKHHAISTGKYVLSALAMGAGLCILTYAQTRDRFNRKEAEKKAKAQPQIPSFQPGRPLSPQLHSSKAAPPIQSPFALPNTPVAVPGIPAVPFARRIAFANPSIQYRA